MAGLPCPHCGEMVDVFGSGGGQAVADSLARLVGAPVPLLGSVPIDPRWPQLAGILNEMMRAVVVDVAGPAALDKAHAELDALLAEPA